MVQEFAPFQEYLGEFLVISPIVDVRETQLIKLVTLKARTTVNPKI